MNPTRLKAMRIDDDSNIRVVFAGRASYLHCLVPTPDDKDKPEGRKSYKTAILVPKDAPKSTLHIIVKAVQDAVTLGIETKWKGVKPSNLQLPLNNGDHKAIDDPQKYAAYEGCWHMTAKRQESFGPPILKANGKAVDRPGVIESGDWCVFDVNFYPFVNINKGVAIGLNAVTLLEVGDRFGGGPSEDSIEKAATKLYGDELTGKEADDLLDSIGSSSAKDELASLLE